MGGSTDASTLAEKAKLEAQLREANESLNDSYYNHAMDSQSNALDDELEAYTKSSEDYIKSLRESIKDTDLIIEQTFQKVVQNSGTVLETIYGLSETYKFPIDSNLTDPWENATQKSLDFETYAKGHIKNIYDYVEEMKGSLAQSLGYPYDSRTTDDMGNPLYEFSWYAAQQIDKVIQDNKDKQDDMKSSLDGGFTQAQSSIQGWSTAASGAVDNVIDKFTGEDGLLDALNKTADRINSMPNYDGGYTEPTSSGSDSGSGSGGTAKTGGYVAKPAGSGYNNGSLTTDQVKALQRYLGFSEKDIDGKWGINSQNAAKAKWGVTSADDAYKMSIANSTNSTKKVTPKTSGKLSSGYSVSGLSAISLGQDDITITIGKTSYKAAVQSYPAEDTDNKLNALFGGKEPVVGTLGMLDKKLYVVCKGGHGWGLIGSKNEGSKATTAFYNKLNGYAKGTLGTTRDQFAITDESWIGEEITLAAGKNGQLQYLKKGSAVMPADISANLVEWGKLNPNMMNIGSMSDGINFMSSYINKPEIKVDVENFLNVGTVSRDTLPELEKLMDKKIDTFAKQLNASIRKFK